MEGALKSIIQNALGEYVWLDRVEAKLPLTLRDLKLREKNIQEVLDEEGDFPFDITSGKIGSLSVSPGWTGTVEIAVSGIVLNLAFSPMKAMRRAMAPPPEESDSDGDTSNARSGPPPSGRRHPQQQHPRAAPLQMRPPVQQAPMPQVPPRYCAAHSSSEQRAKVEPRFMECTGCRVRLQTNYAEFALCPGCSEREKRCMLCGSSAPQAGSYVPAAMIKPLGEHELHRGEAGSSRQLGAPLGGCGCGGSGPGSSDRLSSSYPNRPPPQWPSAGGGSAVGVATPPPPPPPPRRKPRDSAPAELGSQASRSSINSAVDRDRLGYSSRGGPCGPGPLSTPPLPPPPHANSYGAISSGAGGAALASAGAGASLASAGAGGLPPPPPAPHDALASGRAPSSCSARSGYPPSGSACGSRPQGAPQGRPGGPGATGGSAASLCQAPPPRSQPPGGACQGHGYGPSQQTRRTQSMGFNQFSVAQGPPATAGATQVRQRAAGQGGGADETGLMGMLRALDFGTWASCSAIDALQETDRSQEFSNAAPAPRQAVVRPAGRARPPPP